MEEIKRGVPVCYLENLPADSLQVRALKIEV
jgi:hypothetical protein